MNEPSSQSYSLLNGNVRGVQQEEQASSGRQRAGKHALIRCPCSPLCCSITHNGVHLPRHGNSSWVTRKADTKPPLIRKPLSSGKHRVPGLLLDLMSTWVENIQGTVSGSSPNLEASKGSKMYPNSPSALLVIMAKQKINLMDSQMAKEIRYDFSTGLLMRIMCKLFGLISSGFLLLGPTYL